MTEVQRTWGGAPRAQPGQEQLPFSGQGFGSQEAPPPPPSRLGALGLPLPTGRQHPHTHGRRPRVAALKNSTSHEETRLSEGGAHVSLCDENHKYKSVSLALLRIVTGKLFFPCIFLL